MPELILVNPVVGFVCRHQHSEYTVTAVKPHQRRLDGQPTTILHWRTDCRGCGGEVEFTTGASFGHFRTYCKACFDQGGGNGERNARRAAERAVTQIPAPMLLHKAVSIVHPAAMSLADNAPRTIHAPTLLRAALPELQPYTLGEINQGLRDAIARGYLAWDTVGRRTSNRTALKGLWPRPVAALRALGLPVDGAAPAVDVFS